MQLVLPTLSKRSSYQKKLQIDVTFIFLPSIMNHLLQFYARLQRLLAATYKTNGGLRKSLRQQKLPARSHQIFHPHCCLGLLLVSMNRVTQSAKQDLLVRNSGSWTHPMIRMLQRLAVAEVGVHAPSVVSHLTFISYHTSLFLFKPKCYK